MKPLLKNTDLAAEKIATRIRGLLRPAGRAAETSLPNKEAERRLKRLKLLSTFLKTVVGEPAGAPTQRHPANARPHPPATSATHPHLIVLLSGCSWASCDGGQRPVQIARALSRRGSRVVYHCLGDATSFEEDGVTIVGSDVFETVIQKLLPLRGLCIVTLGTYLQEVEGLKAKGRKVCYDLPDDWKSFVERGDVNPELVEKEPRLVRLADVVTCSAVRLLSRARRLGASKVVLVPNGGPDKPFSKARRPPDMLAGQVTVVYAGYLYGSWFDWDAMLHVADKRPGWSFNIVGKYNSVPERPNIRWLGEKPYAQLKGYLIHADCGLIPFRFADVCASVDPIKYYDYLSAGIPTVATEVMTELRGETAHFPGVAQGVGQGSREGNSRGEVNTSGVG